MKQKQRRRKKQRSSSMVPAVVRQHPYLSVAAIVAIVLMWRAMDRAGTHTVPGGMYYDTPGTVSTPKGMKKVAGLVTPNAPLYYIPETAADGSFEFMGFEQ